MIALFLNVPLGQFRFDFLLIKSTNWKVGDPFSKPEWSQCLQVIRPAMELKGYL